MKKIFLIIFAFVLVLLFYTIAFTESGLKNISQSENPNLPDFTAISEEAANDLQKYIKIKTIRGNEIESANFLKAILEKNGIAVKLVSYLGKPDSIRPLKELELKIESTGVALLI